MSVPVEALLGALDDPGRAPAAMRELVVGGEATVSAMRALPLGQWPVPQRRHAVEALVAIGGPAAESMLYDLTDDPDEGVRVVAAAGLRELGSDRAVEACIATLDDAPDPFHADVTPAAVALAEMGARVLPALFPVLDSAPPRTRQRAQRVLERVSFASVGAEVAVRPLSGRQRECWQRLWESNGDYRWDGPEEARRAAVQRWRHWLEESGTVRSTP